MNAIETSRLCELEGKIESGLKTFIDVGTALMEIRDSRLYRSTHGTFEEYCQERWQMDRTYAHRTIEAAKVVSNVLPIGNILPATESQARPLTHVPSEDQPKVWQRVVETAPEGKVTAKHVEAVVTEYRQAVLPELAGTTATNDDWPEPPTPKDATVSLTAQRKPARMSEYILLNDWLEMPSDEQVAALSVASGKTFNRQDGDSIEWAQWSWNPVTGCRHDCNYCYARDIANRFLPQGFEPAIYPDRLRAPFNTSVPTGDNPALRNVFTGSMCDLFGEWVPDEWIQAVLDVIAKNSQWNFLLLTKNPQRYLEFDYSENCLLGTTIDSQERLFDAEDAFHKLDAHTNCPKWYSLEPLFEKLYFQALELVKWVAIGGASRSSRTPEYFPTFDNIAFVHVAARKAGCSIFHKANLGLPTRLRAKEFPALSCP